MAKAEPTFPFLHLTFVSLSVITKITIILIALNIMFISSLGQDTIDRSLQEVNESYNKNLFETAIGANERVIQVNREHLRNDWKGKGGAFEKLGEIDKAFASYDKALKIDPNYEDDVDSKRSTLNRLYHLRKGPYLIYPDNSTSMTVLWQTYYSPNNSTIEWGKINDYVDGKIIVSKMKSILADHLFSYTITNLTPAGRTYYKITLDGESFNGSFVTAPEDSAKSLTFYAYGDSQGNPIIHDRIGSQIRININDKPEDRQTLCLHSGDFVKNGYDEDDWDNEYFNRTALNTRTFQSMIPVMACPGNHEGNAELFRNYLPYNYENTGHDYYSFDYGPIHVAVMDLFASDFRKGSQQYDWLEQDLTNSTKQWKVIVVHEPLWSPGSFKHPGSSEQNGFDAMEMFPDSSMQNELSTVEILRRDLQPLFESKGVKLVLQGHQHYYSRCSVNGIPYLTLGGGGSKLYDPIYDLPQLIMAEKVYHFAEFDISGDKMQVTVIRDDNTTIDSFIINANERFIEKLF
jgi:tetratricopeptide (TPR) repeat protein